MRKLNWEVYLIAFIITLIIFAIGVYIGSLASQKATFIAEQQLEQTKDSLFEMQLLLLLDKSSDACPYYQQQFKKISYNREMLGNELEALERTNTEAPELKSKYFVFEALNYILGQQLNAVCDYKKSQLLYFYSSHCDNCHLFEKKLNDLKNSKKVLVYSFDYDSNEPIVNYLINKYNITKAPAIYYNNQTIYAISSN